MKKFVRIPIFALLLSIFLTGDLPVPFLGRNCFTTVQAAQAANRYVKVEGRNLLVDFDNDGQYEPFFIKGVAYYPTPIGRFPSDWGWPQGDPRLSNSNVFNDDAILERDFVLLQEMNVNTIRIWKANNTFLRGRFTNYLTEKTLEYARAAGIKIIPGFWVDPLGEYQCHNGESQYIYYPDRDIRNPDIRANLLSEFSKFIESFKNRPEILFWAIGNENNLHLNRDDPDQISSWFSLVDEMGQIVRQIEGVETYHPVAIVNGDMRFMGEEQFASDDISLSNVDIWGMNVYRGKDFSDLFYQFSQKSDKPLWISEYGIDAFYAFDYTEPEVGVEDQVLQAEWDLALWHDILANSDVAIGGTLMAYSDNWWKPYEWQCEGEDACIDAIDSENVLVRWEPKIDAYNYDLSLGTYCGGYDIYYSRIGQQSGQYYEHMVSMDQHHLNGGKICAMLRYITGGYFLREYFEIPTINAAANPQDLKQSVTWKLMRPGSVQNHFGFKPVDANCDPDIEEMFFPSTPDHVWHEEWWGVVSSQKNMSGPFEADIVTPREVFYALQSEFGADPPSSVKARIDYPGKDFRVETHDTEFHWTKGQNVSGYRLLVGQNGVGSSDIYSADLGLNRSAIVTGIPLNGQDIYVRLISLIEDEEQYFDTVYSTSVETGPLEILGHTPAQILPLNTSTFPMTVTTSKPAECRFSTRPNNPFESMYLGFDTVNGLQHEKMLYLKNGYNRNFYVRCLDSTNPSSVMESDFVVNVRVDTDRQPPTTPSGLRISDVGVDYAEIVWDESTDNSQEVYYAAFRNNRLIRVYFVESELLDSGLVSKGTYVYRIMAFDRSANISGISDPLVVTLP